MSRSATADLVPVQIKLGPEDRATLDRIAAELAARQGTTPNRTAAVRALIRAADARGKEKPGRTR